MAIELRFRRGTTANHATFTGVEGEVTVDTTKKTLVVHDGVTPGGNPVLTAADVSNKLDSDLDLLTASDPLQATDVIAVDQGASTRKSALSTLLTWLSQAAATLTNKTINLTNNSLSGSKAQFNSALSDDDFGFLGTAQTWSLKQTYTVAPRFNASVGVGLDTPNYAGYSQAVTVLGSTNSALELATSRADGDSANVGGVEWNFQSASVGHQRIGLIQVSSSGATANQRGGRMGFSTKANGSTTLSERMAITAAGNVEHTNFTKLGESSPAIKVKKISTTTPATEGTQVTVAHGVAAAKIVGIQALADLGGNTRIPPSLVSGIAGANLEYNVWVVGANLVVATHSTNSEGVLSKPIDILITYEE